MSIFGKLIGGAAGLALGGPIGLLVGVAAGHLVDHAAGRARGRGQTQQAGSTLERRYAAFTIALIALAAKMAKADGVVTRDEIAAFKRIFKIPEGEAAEVGRLFDAARAEAAGFEPYADQVAGIFKGRPRVLEELLLALAAVAAADGAIHEAERGFLNEVARRFGLGPDSVERVLGTVLPDSGPDPYKVLGIEPEASEAEIKAAYRALMRENHPDRLVAQGVPKEMIDLATKESQAINAAYDRIARDRGIK